MGFSSLFDRDGGEESAQTAFQTFEDDVLDYADVYGEMVLESHEKDPRKDPEV